jgi:two-component system, NarL family, nitrate/nitrite response regulator NarL
VNTKKTVLISTDEPMVEIGINTLLGSDLHFNLLGIFRNLPDLLAAAQLHQPDVVVCGLSRETDLASIHELRSLAPQSAIVLWAREVSAEMAHQAVEQGVLGFLSTTSSSTHFRECLRTAARGELWMEGSLTMSLLHNRPISLSKRQSELISLLVQGLKNKEIATALGISEGTVKAYLTTLYEKVGARDRFDLALYGLRNMGRQHMGQLMNQQRVSPVPAKPLRSVIASRDIA